MRGLLSRMARGAARFGDAAASVDTLPLPSVGAAVSHAGIGSMLGAMGGSPFGEEGMAAGAAFGGAGMLGARMAAPAMQRLIVGLREMLKKQAPHAAQAIDAAPDNEILAVVQKMEGLQGMPGSLTPKERQITEMLRENPNMTRGGMIEKLYNRIDEPENSDRVLSTFLNNTGRKFDAYRSNGNL